MDFLNGIGRKLTRAAKGVQELTRESVENSRVSGELRAAKSELERLYAELGRAYYAQLTGGGKAPASLAERVRLARAQVDALTEHLPVRPQPRCAGCGAVPPEGARYCPACGKRLPEETPDTPENEPDGGEYCLSCGAQRRGPSEYCAVCGFAFGGTEDLPAPARRLKAQEPPEEPETYED